MLAEWFEEVESHGLARLVPRSPGARFAALVGFWSLVGLVAALQRIAAGALGAGAASAWARLAHGWASGLLWVPLTLLIVAIHRRFPFRRAAWRRSLVVHVSASLTVPLLYNLGFTLLPGPASAGEGVVSASVQGYLRWLHINVLVYWCIVALDRWRVQVSSAEPGGSMADADGSVPGGTERSHLTRIPVRTAGRVRVIETGEIAWIEGAGDYIRIHTDGESTLASRRLGDLAERLDPERFLRIHRSTIVNLDRIESYRPLGHGDYRLVLRCGTRLKVSRSRGRAFRRRLAPDQTPG